MTTRRVEVLPDEQAAPILAMLDRARAAAAAPDGAEAPWAAAEAGQTRVRTGYKAARRTLSAGQCAAHTLRLVAAQEADPDPQPWTAALAAAAEPIGSWDWDLRMQGALDLRRTFKDLSSPLPDSVRPVRAVAAWLTHAGGPGLVPVTGRLCGLVLDSEPSQDIVAASWYATHGRRLLAELGGQRLSSGAPGADEARRRAILRTAVRGVASAQIMSKIELAAAAGITRRTLDGWLAQA